jgi:cytoskeletal protein CcmA (bactofilin family)
MFNKNEQRPVARTGGSGSMSFLGAEVTITGNIGGQGNLHIDGRVDGDVACGSLIIGNSGQVNGNITADDAKIAGTVTGTVAAKVLTIESSARITGDLSYDSVSVETGAQVDGRVKRLTREEPTGLKLIASE